MRYRPQANQAYGRLQEHIQLRTNALVLEIRGASCRPVLGQIRTRKGRKNFEYSGPQGSTPYQPSGTLTFEEVLELEVNTLPDPEKWACKIGGKDVPNPSKEKDELAWIKDLPRHPGRRR